MSDNERTIARAKIVAHILTENGHPVMSPYDNEEDGGVIVEKWWLQQWNICLEIVRALDNAS